MTEEPGPGGEGPQRASEGCLELSVMGQEPVGRGERQLEGTGQEP